MPKKLSQLTPKQRAARIARLASDPRTRAAIPDRYLPPEFRARREQARKAKAPLVPGGEMTYGEFLKARKAAADTTFAPVKTQLEQQTRDVPGWYDSYLRELQGIQERVRTNYQAQQAHAQQLGQTSAAPAPGMEQDATAQQAGQARKALLDAFAASTGEHGARSFEQLGALQATAGREKVQRQQQLSDEMKELEKRRGEFYTTYGVEARDREQKAALERALFTSKEDAAAAQARAAADKTKTERQRYDEKLNKYGYENAVWRKLSAERKAAIRAAARAKQGADKGVVYSEGAFAGYTKREVEAMSTEERRRIAAAHKKKADKGGGSARPKSGPGSATPEAQSRAFSEIRTTERTIRDLKANGMSYGDIRGVINRGYYLSNGKKVTVPRANPDFVNVAMDLVRRPGISRTNLRVLHDRYGLRLGKTFPILRK